MDWNIRQPAAEIYHQRNTLVWENYTIISVFEQLKVNILICCFYVYWLNGEPKVVCNITVVCSTCVIYMNHFLAWSSSFRRQLSFLFLWYFCLSFTLILILFILIIVQALFILHVTLLVRNARRFQNSECWYLIFPWNKTNACFSNIIFQYKMLFLVSVYL